MISHFYKCFGCGRRHEDADAAVTCCSVVQEIWECTGCGEQMPTKYLATVHAAAFEKQGYCVAANAIPGPTGTIREPHMELTR